MTIAQPDELQDAGLSPRRLLIAVSSPAGIERELAWGSAIARAMRIPATLLYLLDPGMSREPAERAAASAGDLLAVAASDERMAGLEVTVSVRVGLPHEELREATESEPGSIALILVDNPGMLRRALLGTDAHSVLRSLRTPFIILPQHTIPPITIGRAVVGDDGSELSRRVLRVASELAPILGVSLTTVEVVEPSSVSLSEFLAVQPELTGPRVVVRGHAGETLLTVARARGAGLIVVGSHGQGQMTRLLLGSTSEWLANNADRPLLIVPAAHH